MATATKLGLIERCQTAAEEFPIGLTDVAKRDKADAGMYFEIPWYLCSESMPSSAERALRVHQAEPLQVCRCFENHYKSILKIEGAGGSPLLASFKRKFIAEPDVDDSLSLDVAEAEVFCPTSQDPSPGGTALGLVQAPEQDPPAEAAPPAAEPPEPSIKRAMKGHQ
jgi:hypothetical protein